MQIGEWKATKHLNKIYNEIRELGLEQNVAELEAYGFTVVEPQKVASPQFIDQLADAIVAVARKRKGQNGGGETAYGRGESPVGELVYSLLSEGRVFEEAILNRARPQ